MKEQKTQTPQKRLTWEEAVRILEQLMVENKDVLIRMKEWK